jgi:two-component system, chemotaxis family, sensor kinase Cph1
MNAALDAALAGCASEPIHVPGAVQPHGMLLVVDPSTWKVRQASANAIGVLLDAEPGLHGGASLGEVVGTALVQAVEATIASAAPLESPLLLGRFNLAQRSFEALLHRSGRWLVLELEADANGSGRDAGVYADVRSFGAWPREGITVDALCQAAADEMRRLTGFGRTMVYRFDEDGHGVVLAESLQQGYDSYAGQHFPASDIPPQARELYRRNRIRLIVDASYRAVPLLPRTIDGEATDLSFATLRSVSPVHLEYMRNMGTAASMSVSVLVGGRLWGLISCHHATTRRLPVPLRIAAEHVGQLLSLQIEAHEASRAATDGVRLRRLLVALVATVVEGDNALERLADAADDLLQFGAASGAAVVVDGRCRLVGQTPSAAEVLALADWIASLNREVYASDRLAEEHAPAHAYAKVASGVLALSVSQLHRHLVMWFRPETVHTLEWAGDPRKSIDEDASGGPRLHPRRSFATWHEVVRGRSARWQPSEVTVAAELRHALLEIVLRSAEEVAALAGALSRTNKELEDFSYSVSHDLRAPLRHITGYADLIAELDGKALGERSSRYLHNIKTAARFAGTLVDDLLSFSQMGRSTLRPIDIDMDGMVQGIIGRSVLGSTTPPVFEVGPLPRIHADPVFMQVAMQNLIGNAIKYSSRRERPVIRISGEEAGDDCVIRVSDNGVGFDMKYVGKLFGVFQRLHGVEEYEGTGIGLASVHRAVERHGGRVEAYGELDRGATFTLTLPRRGAPASTLSGSS